MAILAPIQWWTGLYAQYAMICIFGSIIIGGVVLYANLKGSTFRAKNKYERTRKKAA